LLEDTKMTNGNVVLNGISDKELLVILDVKLRYEGKLQFNPQQMKPVDRTTPGGQLQNYNNVSLTWSNNSGVQAVKEILHKLTE
jgi:hypothetical protein